VTNITKSAAVQVRWVAAEVAPDQSPAAPDIATRLEKAIETTDHAAPFVRSRCRGYGAFFRGSLCHSLFGKTAMSFKETPAQFMMIDVSLIEPDANHPRKNVDETGLRSLANSIQMKGLIHPVVVRPADAAGKHTLIVGERRWRAAVMAGEKTVPALVRPCDSGEALEIQVFENLGVGMRTALEPRDMSRAIQAIADRFETREAAAEHFGRNANWLNQATAAANLSAKVTALLDAGKIASTGAAVQLEKLAQKSEDKAESLIGQIEQLPEGKALSKKAVDGALSEVGGRRKKKEEPAAGRDIALPAPTAGAAEAAPFVPPWEALPAEPKPVRRRVDQGKVEMVARILGLADSDEEEILDRLIDEFLALKNAV
jgi:ParB family chromosome partitioning protein